ncbi:MAG: DsrE family protein [Candidatus Eremiobacteraeota bacterium]|nr:DsrE family protein [Candidatus Eremiobacteraeota bacterium]
MAPTVSPPIFQEKDLSYYLRMIRREYSEFEEPVPQKSEGSAHVRNIVVVFGSESIGKGKEGLGKKLMYLLLQSLINGSTKPRAIILMNDAVKMSNGKSESMKKLVALEDQGSKIMVCVSSAEEYDLADNMQVGFLASMDEICETIMTAWKVITL